MRALFLALFLAIFPLSLTAQSTAGDLVGYVDGQHTFRLRCQILVAIFYG